MEHSFTKTFALHFLDTEKHKEAKIYREAQQSETKTRQARKSETNNRQASRQLQQFDFYKEDNIFSIDEQSVDDVPIQVSEHLKN